MTRCCKENTDKEEDAQKVLSRAIEGSPQVDGIRLLCAICMKNLPRPGGEIIRKELVEQSQNLHSPRNSLCFTRHNRKIS